METVEFQAQDRQVFDKNAVKQLRKTGFIPAVVYGLANDPSHLQLDSKEFNKLYRQYKNQNVLITLKTSDKHWSVLSKEVTRDVISREVIHVDFQLVDLNKEVKADIQLKFVGIAPGVKMGGTLRTNMSHITVRSLPNNIPSHLDIELSALGIGDSLRVRDINADGQFDILTTPDEIVVFVESQGKVDTPQDGAAN